ncbi:hypothetical protein ACQEU3_41825 [Spirillospora sp. CA-253888]
MTDMLAIDGKGGLAGVMHSRIKKISLKNSFFKTAGRIFGVEFAERGGGRDMNCGDEVPKNSASEQVQLDVEKMIDEHKIEHVKLESRPIGAGLVDLWIEGVGIPAICVSTAEVSSQARILVGPYTFDGVPLGETAPFVRRVFEGDYEVRLSKSFFREGVWMSVPEGWEDGRVFDGPLAAWEADRLRTEDCKPPNSR